MQNDRLENLGAGPFDRLRSLLSPIEPPSGVDPIVMSIGEPQHDYPDFVGDVIDANRHLYGKYPPLLGTDEYRVAVADWLTRRYRLEEGMIDPDRHVVPLAGTREGLYLMAPVVVPEATQSGGRNARPVVVLPNPFYQVYLGASVFSGAETVFAPCTKESGFLPDLSDLDEDALERAAMVFICTPTNPQGAVAEFDRLCGYLEMARRHDFLLVVDECYAEIYDTQPPPGALEACRHLGGSMENVVVFHSLSKRSSVPASPPAIPTSCRNTCRCGLIPRPRCRCRSTPPARRCGATSRTSWSTAGSTAKNSTSRNGFWRAALIFSQPWSKRR